jgi:RinA family phage transcriptional activator
MEVEQVSAAPERNEFKLSPAEFKFVEHKLFTYQNNKRVIEEYLAQRDELIHRTRHTEPGLPHNQGVGRPVENTVVQMLILEQKAQRELFWVKAIEDVFGLLPDEDKKLVELKYFEGYLTNAGVARRLNVSEREFYRRRERIVWRFANRFGLV